MLKAQEIRFMHDPVKTIAELEVALCIDGEDYASRDIDRSLVKIHQRLQRQYSIDLSGSLKDTYSTALIGDEIKNFLDNLEFMYNKMCGISHYFRYVHKVPVSLSSVNYLGITKDSMLAILQVLQLEGRQDSLDSVMEQIKSKIGTIPMCIEKKLFMLLYVSYDLELHELTAVIAEILYLGGI